MSNHRSYAKLNHGAGVRTDREIAGIISQAIGKPYPEQCVQILRVKAERKIREACNGDSIILAMLADGIG